MNFNTEKSEAKDACFPSLPSIPIPTLEHYIIPTSLPPSPIPHTTFFNLFFMYKVTSAFYFGAHLHMITL